MTDGAEAKILEATLDQAFTQVPKDLDALTTKLASSFPGRTRKELRLGLGPAGGP